MLARGWLPSRGGSHRHSPNTNRSSFAASQPAGSSQPGPSTMSTGRVGQSIPAKPRATPLNSHETRTKIDEGGNHTPMDTEARVVGPIHTSENGKKLVTLEFDWPQFDWPPSSPEYKFTIQTPQLARCTRKEVEKYFWLEPDQGEFVIFHMTCRDGTDAEYWRVLSIERH